jgi:gas vesicle protein
LIALVTAVFIIKSKINKIHDQIEQKINSITRFAEKGGEWASAVTRIISKSANVAKKARR